VSFADRLDFYDAELRAHHEHLRAAYDDRQRDDVLEGGFVSRVHRASSSLDCGPTLWTGERDRAGRWF